jgi:hypothetical protein
MPNMTETPHQTKSSEATPEQLMQLLDLQIASQKAKRNGGRNNRATLLVGGILIILGGLFAALLVLQEMAGDLRSHAGPVTQVPAAQDSQ